MANYRGDVAAILNSPEWQAYQSAGRVAPPPSDSYKKDAIWALKYAQQELARVKGEDKTISNYYELATGQKATPEVIGKYAQYAGDPALLQAAIGKGAATAAPLGTSNDLIQATIQDKLGRAATDAELNYFGKQIEAGNLDAYGLQNFLQGTNEYQSRYAKQAQEELKTSLGGIDTEYMDKTAKQLQSAYAAQGRTGSSAFGSALIKAGQDLAKGRTEYLAGIGYDQALRGQQNLRGDYQAQLENMYRAQQGISALGQESRQRYYSQQDFNRQQQAEERLRRLSQPKSGSFLQNLVPGLITGGAQAFSAYLGRPQYAAPQQQQQWQGVPYRVG